MGSLSGSPIETEGRKGGSREEEGGGGSTCCHLEKEGGVGSCTTWLSEVAGWRTGEGGGVRATGETGARRGPVGSDRGVRERERARAAVGRRHAGSGGTVLGENRFKL
jgi:hypothetical protein